MFHPILSLPPPIITSLCFPFSLFSLYFSLSDGWTSIWDQVRQLLLCGQQTHHAQQSRLRLQWRSVVPGDGGAESSLCAWHGHPGAPVPDKHNTQRRTHTYTPPAIPFISLPHPAWNRLSSLSYSLTCHLRWTYLLPEDLTHWFYSKKETSFFIYDSCIWMFGAVTQCL